MADHFNLETLINGTNSLYHRISSELAKAALLFYLDDKIKKNVDPQTYTSYILFKEDFTETKRNEMQGIYQRFCPYYCLQ